MIDTINQAIHPYIDEVDQKTKEFMTTFYRNWLEENMTIPEAFRKTQREMRDRFFNPYSWAGFVLVE